LVAARICELEAAVSGPWRPPCDASSESPTTAHRDPPNSRNPPPANRH
jgi:hypothetical protein